MVSQRENVVVFDTHFVARICGRFKLSFQLSSPFMLTVCWVAQYLGFSLGCGRVLSVLECDGIGSLLAGHGGPVGVLGDLYHRRSVEYLGGRW